MTEKLHKLGIYIDLSSASFACISVSLDDSEDYYNSRWIHGRERLISAIEQIINTDHPFAYSGLTFFYEQGFDIL